MLKKTSLIGLALVVAVGASVAPIQAQRGMGSRGQAGPHAGRSLELALEHQEQIGLSSEQAAQLQELKALANGTVLPLAEEIKVLRDQIQAGEVEWSEGFRQMEALRGELITAAAPMRGRVQEILTVAQHNQLQGLVRQDRPAAGRGRAAQGGQGRGRGFVQGQPGRVGVGVARGGMMRGRGQGQPPGIRGGQGFRQGPGGQGRGPGGIENLPQRGF